MKQYLAVSLAITVGLLSGGIACAEEQPSSWTPSRPVLIDEYRDSEPLARAFFSVWLTEQFLVNSVNVLRTPIESVDTQNGPKLVYRQAHANVLLASESLLQQTYKEHFPEGLGTDPSPWGHRFHEIGYIAKPLPNISEYRVDMLRRISKTWVPPESLQLPIVLITLNRTGKAERTEIYVSSGNESEDRRALSAVNKTEFAPLPEWFRGDNITFKVELTKVEKVRQSGLSH